MFGFGKKRKEKRELEYVSSFSVNGLGSSSIDRTPTALSALYRAVDLISDSIAELPVSVKRVVDKNRESVKEHPLNLIFTNKTDSNITFFQLKKLLIQSVLLKGHGFAYIYRDREGNPKKLRFLKAGDVTVNYNERTDELTYTASKIQRGRIEPINMIDLKKFTYDGIHGVSIVKNAWRTIEIASAAENSANRFYKDGGSKIGYIKAVTPISAKQKQQIITDWASAYGGENMSSRIAVLGNNLDYNSISVDAEDAQLLETREFSVDEIARWFGVSPVLLGDLSHSSYSTIEASLLQFLSQTLKPWIVLLEEEFTRKLLKPSESDLVIDIDDEAVLLSDKSTLANYYSTLLNAGVYSINEVRSKIGMSEVEGGDRHLIPFTNVNSNDIAANQINKAEEQNQVTDTNEENLQY